MKPIQINMAPRTYGEGGVKDYRNMKCADCGHAVMVKSGFSQDAKVYCMECAQTAIQNNAEENERSPEGLGDSLDFSIQDGNSLRHIWSLLDSGYFSDAESALASLSPTNTYAQNALGVCFLRQNKVKEAMRIFQKLVCLHELDTDHTRKFNPQAKPAWLSNYLLTLFFTKNQSGFDLWYTKLNWRVFANPALFLKYKLLMILYPQWITEHQLQGWLKRFLGITPDCMNMIPNKEVGWSEEEFDAQ